jgi:HTH-type transcriptional regulator, quorum sensing regulator NprR
MPVTSLGKRIRARRNELGLTQQQLGGKDLTKGFISLVEKDRARPSLETLVLLAERLQKPVSYFLEQGTPLSLKAAQAALSMGWVAVKQGDYTRAAESFQEALNSAKGRHDPRIEAECHIGLGLALASLRQFDLARQNVERGRHLADATKSEELLVRASHALGVIAYYERNFRDAREHFLEGFRRFQGIDHPDKGLGGLLLHNLGTTYTELGDHAEAARWYQEALTVLEPTEDLHRLGMIYLQLGVTHRERGDYDTALSHLRRAESLFGVLEDTRLLGWAHNSIGMTFLARGEVDKAINHLEESLRIKERIGDDAGRGRSLTELGRALTAKRAFPKAEKALAEADRLARKFQDVTETARIHLARARLRSAMGQVPEAVRSYKHAIASFESLGMRTDVAHACNALGELLLQHKRPSVAAPYLARALQELRASQAT